MNDWKSISMLETDNSYTFVKKFMMRPIPSSILWIFLLLVMLSACTREETASSPNKEELEIQSVEDYYASHSDFFTFSEPSFIPLDLVWENGLDQPEFANIEAPKGGTLHLAIADFPKTLRFIGPDSNSGLRSVLYDNNSLSLLDIHPETLAFIPSIASSWAKCDDRKTVFFKLNPKATYSDGTPIKSGDFLYAFYFMQSPHIQSPFHKNWITESFECITYYDDLTFSITLKNQSIDLLWDCNLTPIPRHYYGTLKADFLSHYQWDFPPTTGAYEVKPEGIIKGRKIIATRVQNWWAKEARYYRGRYNVDTIIYRVVRDNPKEFEIFRKGDLDIVDLTLPESWYKRAKIPEIKKGYIKRSIFYNIYPQAMAGIYLNEDAGILKNIHVRKGIAYSLNIDLAIQTFFHGDFKRLRTCADGYPGYTNPRILLIPFSPEKAEAEFALAGFTQRGKDGILYNDQGKRLSFTLVLINGPLKEVYTLLQHEARKAGLEILLEALDPLTAYTKCMSKHHEACSISWGRGFSLRPIGYWQLFHSSNAHKEGSNNITNTADPKLDRLIELYDKAEDESNAQDLSYKIQKQVAEHFAYIPTWYCPYYRVAYWRWLCFPKAFNVPISHSALQYGLHWIDESIKKETLKAKKEGHCFDASIQINKDF